MAPAPGRHAVLVLQNECNFASFCITRAASVCRCASHLPLSRLLHNGPQSADCALQQAGCDRQQSCEYGAVLYGSSIDKQLHCLYEESGVP